MKKLTLLVAACFLAITASFAQATKLGLLVGPNFSTFVQSQGNETSSATVGFHVTVFTEIDWHNWSLVPGLSYASIGGKSSSIDTHGAGGSETSSYSIRYFQVPVNIMYNTRGRRFFFGGGPYVGFGLSGRVKGNLRAGNFTAPPTIEDFDQNYPFTTEDNPDFGLNILAGVHLEGGTIISIGYGFGLKYLFSGSNANIKNNVFSISFGHSIL